jgi:hypothetical protein
VAESGPYFFPVPFLAGASEEGDVLFDQLRRHKAERIVGEGEAEEFASW